MDLFIEYRNVRKLLQSHHAVVFYAESRYYYSYLQNLVEGIVANSKQVVYITSDKSDKLLVVPPAGVQVFYIHSMLAFLMPRLRAEVMVMTMPDLGNFIFKRSKLVKKYIYVFHAAVSTHQQYTKESFFHYDTVFCAGQYHQKEIRAAELQYGLQKKQLVPFGYPLFETIHKKYVLTERIGRRKRNLLIAPSWYESCIFDTCIEELVQVVSLLPFEISIRPHPEYVKRRSKKWEDLQIMMKKLPNITIDINDDVVDSIVSSDILITDRSGIAFEFAFGTFQPVLFIDTPPKTMNTSWPELNIDPIENNIRRQLGISIQPSEIPIIGRILEDLQKFKTDYENHFKNLRSILFFNSEEGLESALNFIDGQTSMGVNF